MIEAQYRTANGRFTFKVQGENTTAVFLAVADLAEVFEAETTCGVCNSPHIRPVHRIATKGRDTYNYYELHCQQPGCRARFAFGQLKAGGGLYPKRKDDNGAWLNNRGWGKYVKPGDEESGPNDYEYSQEAPPDAGRFRGGSGGR